MGRTKIVHKYCCLCGKQLINKRADAIYCTKCLRDIKDKYGEDINKQITKIRKQTRLLKSIRDQEDLLDELSKLISREITGTNFLGEPDIFKKSF